MDLIKKKYLSELDLMMCLPLHLWHFLTVTNQSSSQISHILYPVWAELFGIPYEKKAVNDAFEIQKEDYYAENGGVVFPNPNAPTGAFLSLEVVEDIIQHNQDVVVIVDEAYIDFGGDTAKELTRKYDNVLVVQTYSKSRSLAGLRIGYAIGNKELIKAMNDVKYSYNSYTCLLYTSPSPRD